MSLTNLSQTVGMGAKLMALVAAAVGALWVALGIYFVLDVGQGGQRVSTPALVRSH
jgi:hypothetical protein